MVNRSHGNQQMGWLKSEVLEWIKALLIAFALVAMLRWLLFTPTIVSGESMTPNFEDKQRLIVNKVVYMIREPERGEVIVFHAPEHKDYIKRVIGLPGETVKVDGDDVYINGRKIEEPYIAEKIKEAEQSGFTYNRRNYKVTSDGLVEATVPEGKIFVMGDNRSNSKDSRMESVGFISIDEIVGRADIVFWPLSELEWIDHPDYEVEP